MNTILKTAMLLMITCYLSSCATHYGTVTSNAALTGTNYKTVDFAYGNANANYILGIGGFKKDALVLEAKRNLYANYSLKSEQVFANISVDFDVQNYLVWMRQKAIVSAEVVSYNLNDTLLIASKIDTALTLFTRGMKVERLKGSRFVECRILDIRGKRASVQTKNKKDYIKFKSVRLNKLYFQSGSFTLNDKAYKPGDFLAIPFYAKRNQVSGTEELESNVVNIIAFNHKYVLVKPYNGKQDRIKLKNLHEKP